MIAADMFNRMQDWIDNEIKRHFYGTATTAPTTTMTADEVRLRLHALKYEFDKVPPPVRLYPVPDYVMPQEPMRTVRLRHWHAERCYARRVQKKWNKRYGTKPQLVAFQFEGGYFVARSHYLVMKHAMGVKKPDLSQSIFNTFA